MVPRQRAGAPSAGPVAPGNANRSGRGRLSLPDFKLRRPPSLEEAVSHLAKHASSPVPLRIVAGGTDLIPSMRQKLFEPEFVLDLRHVAELQGIREKKGSGVEIGALTSLTAVEYSELLR